MFKSRKILSVLLVVAMLVSTLCQTASAQQGANPFSDIKGHWAFNQIQKLSDMGIVKGASGKYRPNDPITRAEFCTIINKLFGYTLASESGFVDVRKDQWYYRQIEIAAAAGYISGDSKNLFYPEKGIAREDAVVMVSNAFQIVPSKADAITAALSAVKDSDGISDYARSAVGTFLNNGYLSGNSNKQLLPKDNLTRAELAAILDKIVGRLYSVAGTYSEASISGNVIINTPMVELNDTVISGDLYLAQGIGDGDVVLKNVKVSGRTYINGGGSHSVKVEDSVLGETIVNKVGAAVRIVLTGSSSIKSLELASSIVIDENKEGMGIEMIHVPEGMDGAGIKIEILSGSFGNILLDSRVEVVIKEGADVSKIALSDTARGSSISCGGTVQTVENKAEAVSINGKNIAAGSSVRVNGSSITPVNGSSSGNNGGSSNSSEWQLVWSDEFEGNIINNSKWTYDLGDGGSNPGWGNNEKELYTNDAKNVYQKDGLLNITAIKDTGNASYPYSSTRIKTQGKFSKKYGKIEAKIKLPEGKGLWPAFWMMPEDSVYGAWASSGEIDIMEAKGSINNKVYGTIHYGKKWPDNKYSGSTYTMKTGETTADWHTYAIEWEPGEIRWYVDGERYQTQNNWYCQGVNTADKYSFPAPFDQNFYIIMNMAVGGNYDGEPEENTLFPSTMQVDYVRVYELGGRAYKTPVEPSTASEPLPEGYKAMPDGNLVFNNQYDHGFIEENDSSKVPADTAAAIADGKWLFLHLTTGGNDFGGAGSITTEAIDSSIFAKADVTSAGSQAYSVQLIKPVTLAKGRYYKASFDAKSTGNRNISVKLSGDGDAGWAAYSNGDTIALTSEMKHYEFTFQMSQASDLKARYEFNIGLSTLPVWIGNVRLEEVAAPQVDVDAAKTPIGDGNHVYNGTFDQGDMSRMMYWHLVNNNGAASARVSEDSRELKVSISDGGTSPGAITLVQKGMKLIAGQTYQISFSGRASTARDISVELLSQDGTAAYSGKNTISLTTGMETKTFRFKMIDTSDSNGQLIFNLGGANGDVFIDNVVMTRESEYIDPSIELFPLQNGFFQNISLDPWGSYIHNDGAAGAVSLENGAARVSLTNTGNETWSIQLFQNALNMASGVEYEVSFDARSTIDRDIELILDDSSYTRYFDQTASVTDEMQHYSYTLKLDSQKTLNLKFLLGKINGAGGAHDIYIDNVVCEVKVGKQLKNLLKNGTFTEGTNGMDNWTVWSDAGASGSVTSDPALDVHLTGNGSAFWSNQVIQGNFELKSGGSYVLIFDAKSTTERKIQAILENSSNYTKYLQQDISLGSEYKTYYIFLNGVDDSSVHLVLALGKINDETLSEHDVLIKNVCLMENPYGYEIDPKVGHSLLNGTFDTNLDNWGTYFGDGAGGTNSTIIVTDGMASAVATAYDGWFQWSAQLYQENIHLEAGKTYTLCFDTGLAPVTSTSAIDIATKDILVCIESGSDTNIKYLSARTVTVNTAMNTVSFDFTMPAAGDENGKLIFMLGSNNVPAENFKPHTIHIDNVILTEKQ